MDLEIKKRYVMSKKHVYGVDNEYQIIQQIQKRMQEILSEKQSKVLQQINNGGATSDTAESEIEMELDEETHIALKITADLKE